ncbi:MAG: hypothetical protein JWM98_3083 [Thermoleophilia bacterium]|nr:hypothetical protein [Thermoleophilia bacterium]
MDDETPTERLRPNLRLVREPVHDPAAAVPPPRPRSIGRLIAQTALIADSAVNRRESHDVMPEGRGMAGRLLGRFR